VAVRLSPMQATRVELAVLAWIRRFWKRIAVRITAIIRMTAEVARSLVLVVFILPQRAEDC
jgi:hypothetical protein